MTSTPEPSTEYVSRLSDVSWPEDAVFIVDEALPADVIGDLQAEIIYVEAGEKLKSLARVEELAAEVLDIRSTRPLTLVAVGGGSVGDAIGFLASILWRGVGLWHVPTTLLAMVDSAHGGKTAVNLGGRKNQLGTFYPAQKVILCESILRHLPLALREEGLVELLKALWLGAPGALHHFDDSSNYAPILIGDVRDHRPIWQDLLEQSIAVKAEVVAKDPRETGGLRRILNLGHTAGHGLEALYGLPHGRAIAWGMAACAILSADVADLSSQDADRLLRHLEPLLTPLPEYPSALDKETFIACLKKDKKQKDGQLISILLDAPGVPIQTTEISPERWWEATRKAFELWQTHSLTISPGLELVTSPIDLPPDKSQANRAAVIAHLRPAVTDVVLPQATPPTDITDLRLALGRLRNLSDDESVAISTGNGGTVGRFLMAVAATRPGITQLTLSPGLQKRPHDPLLDALRRGGATIEPVHGGFQIQGWKHFPSSFQVDGKHSSQFASALALLAATGNTFTLDVDGPLVSRPYFDLTLKLLASAGITGEEITVTDSGRQRFHFSPTTHFYNPTLLEIPSDTSSAVVWHALAALFDDFDPPAFPDFDHPDSQFAAIASELTESQEITVNLANAPDLAPVLAALATQLPTRLLITDAAHLRHKETDRISELAQSFEEVGIQIETRPDGLLIPSGIQTATAGALFDPREDHRLVMAALVLASGTAGLQVNDALCVAKSYPDFWRHARLIGFEVTSEVESFRVSRRPNPGNR